MFTQEEINQGIQNLIKEQEKKMTDKNRAIDRGLIVGWIVAMMLLGIVFAVMHIDETSRTSRDDTLIHSQQQTIEAQETIIDVQKGLIGGLVLENNKNFLETNDYRARWLEAIK